MEDDGSASHGYTNGQSHAYQTHHCTLQECNLELLPDDTLV